MIRTIALPPKPYRPLSEDAYQALRDAILNGVLAPGERVVEAEIARQMGISRNPIREAIRKLEQDGLVEYHPRRGTVVAALSADEVRDAYRLRAYLEAYAVRLAVPRLTSADLTTLESSLNRMRECAGRGDLSGFIAADVAFHAHICRASGSKRLYRLWDSLNPHCWTLLTSLKTTEYSLPERAERHVPVLSALSERDSEAAVKEIRRHILELADTVLAHLSPEELSATNGDWELREMRRDGTGDELELFIGTSANGIDTA